MRATVCAIVAAIGLAAHPAFAQADRTAAPFWKTVQATCDATAAKPAERARPAHRADGDRRVHPLRRPSDRCQRPAVPLRPDRGGARGGRRRRPAGEPRPSRLVAGDEILAGAVRRRHRGQARGARLSRRLDLDAGDAGRGAVADHRRPAPARRRGRVRSGGARNPARGGLARGHHRYPVVGGLHQLRDPAVGRRGECVPVRQCPSRLYLRRVRGERGRADQRGRRPALSRVSAHHNQTSRRAI